MKNSLGKFKIQVDSYTLSRMSLDLQDTSMRSLAELGPHEIKKSLQQCAELGHWEKWTHLLGWFGSIITSTYTAVLNEGELETDEELDFVQTLGRMSELYGTVLTAVNTLGRQLHNDEEFDSPLAQSVALANYVPALLERIADQHQALIQSPFPTLHEPTDAAEFDAKLTSLKASMYPECYTLPFATLGLIETSATVDQFADYAIYVCTSLRDQLESNDNVKH